MREKIITHSHQIIDTDQALERVQKKYTLKTMMKTNDTKGKKMTKNITNIDMTQPTDQHLLKDLDTTIKEIDTIKIDHKAETDTKTTSIETDNMTDEIGQETSIVKDTNLDLYLGADTTDLKEIDTKTEITRTTDQALEVFQMKDKTINITQNQIAETKDKITTQGVIPDQIIIDQFHLLPET